MTETRMIAVPVDRHLVASGKRWEGEQPGDDCYSVSLTVCNYRVGFWWVEPPTNDGTIKGFRGLLEWIREFAAAKVRLLFTDQAEEAFGTRSKWIPELVALLALGDADAAASAVAIDPDHLWDLRQWEQTEEWRRKQAERPHVPQQGQIPVPVTPAPPTSRKERKPRRTVLYRHYDVGDVLLYVGISGSQAARDTQHSSGAVWALFAARVESVWLDSREEALTEELAAIKNEVPIFNKKDAPPGRDQRVQDYLASQGRLDLLEQALGIEPSRDPIVVGSDA